MGGSFVRVVALAADVPASLLDCLPACLPACAPQIELCLVQFQLMLERLLPELHEHMEELCADSNFVMKPTCVVQVIGVQRVVVVELFGWSHRSK